jgi:isoquinoline 1-oxidoreductase beta subunit
VDDQLRTVGRQARTMLMQAAADQWKVKLSTCARRRASCSARRQEALLRPARRGRRRSCPCRRRSTLKAAKDFKVIGKPTRRLDSADKVSGKAMFGLDVQRKNLHTAWWRIRRSSARRRRRSTPTR